MLLIVTGPHDDHLAHVRTALDRRGAAHHVIDPGALGSDTRLTVDIGPTRESARVATAEGDSIELSEVDTVWLRARSHGDGPRGVSTERHLERAVGLIALHGGRVVPAALDVMAHASSKILQLHVARSVGLSVPRTLVTNDPDEVLRFASTGIPLVGKELAPDPALAVGVRPFARYTNDIAPHDLLHVDDLALAPLVVQEKLDKALELRVTVVGDQTFTAAIDSAPVHHSSTDFRRYDLASTTIRPWHLSAATEAACLRLVRYFGLLYATLDLILTPEGDHVFLDLNPNGQYLWIETHSGLDITEALVDLLTAAAGT